jgi:hypothetical protein
LTFDHDEPFHSMTPYVGFNPGKLASKNCPEARQYVAVAHDTVESSAKLNCGAAACSGVTTAGGGVSDHEEPFQM